MTDRPILPGEVEVYGSFSKHLGPRFMAAGLGIRFHYNQSAGIHFKVDVPDIFREAIIKGLSDGMADRFPQFPKTGSIWVTSIKIHEVDSSWSAFYQVARMVIEQSYYLALPYEV